MNLRSAFLLTIIISIFSACTKIETTDIGTGLIPPVDNISTFDSSLQVQTRNFLDTGYVYPLRTDNLVLGRISNDQLFGKTTGIINLELRPEYHPFRFRGIFDSLKLDSMVLVLSYRGVWGDTANANPAIRSQKLTVYEIDPAGTNQLTPDSIYSTRIPIAHKSTALGSVTVDPKNMRGPDTLKTYGETINKDQIRIRITDAATINKFFKDTTLLDSAKGFKAKFAGFAVVPDTSGAVVSNNLIVVNLADTNTKMAFYYSGRVSGSTKRDTLATYYRFTSAAGFSNHIIRNQAAATADFALTIGGGTDSLVYLQTRPDAPYTRIKIPGLDSLKNCIIHRAELVMEQVRTSPVAGSSDDFFTPPALFLTAYSSDSSRRFMLPSSDVQFTTSGVSNLADFGSFPNRRYVNGAYVSFYSFNLTRYVQAIATNKNRNYDLVLWAPFADYVYAVENFNSLIPVAGSSILNPLAIGRIRVGGGSHSQHRMRLRIVYTKI